MAVAVVQVTGCLITYMYPILWVYAKKLPEMVLCEVGVELPRRRQRTKLVIEGEAGEDVRSSLGRDDDMGHGQDKGLEPGRMRRRFESDQLIAYTVP